MPTAPERYAALPKCEGGALARGASAALPLHKGRAGWHDAQVVWGRPGGQNVWQTRLREDASGAGAQAAAPKFVLSRSARQRLRKALCAWLQVGAALAVRWPGGWYQGVCA